MSPSHGKVNTVAISQDGSITKLIAKAVASCRREFLAKINELKADDAALKLEVQTVKESQQFISDKYDLLKTSYDTLLETNNEQKMEITQLHNQTKVLKDRGVKDEEKFDALKQYSRR